MRLGKLKPTVMKRSVQRQLHILPEEESTNRPGLLTVHTVEGRTLAAKRLLDGAVGKMVAAGGIPQSLAFSILLPEEEEEAALKSFTGSLHEECSSWDLPVTSCDAAVSGNVRCPVVTASCLGAEHPVTDPSSSGVRPVTDLVGEDAARPGRPEASPDLLVAGSVGTEGAAMIAIEQRERLLTRYPAFFIDEAAEAFQSDVLRALMKILYRNDSDGQGSSVRCRYLGEGGFFAGLWELAAAAGAGLEIELSRVPIKQHTIEVCEFFNRNPYQLFSGGSMLIACENGGRLAGRLEREGVCARVIGHTTGGNARLIRYDEEIRYLEPPKTDEYYLLKKQIQID